MKSRKIGAFQAKTHLSQLLDRVDRGEVFVITRRGRPVAELRPLESRAKLRFGSDAGYVTIGNDFDAAVPGMDEYGG